MKFVNVNIPCKREGFSFLSLSETTPFDEAKRKKYWKTLHESNRTGKNDGDDDFRKSRKVRFSLETGWIFEGGRDRQMRNLSGTATTGHPPANPAPTWLAHFRGNARDSHGKQISENTKPVRRFGNTVPSQKHTFSLGKGSIRRHPPDHPPPKYRKT